MTHKTIKVDDHLIGSGEKPFIIAEISCNHMGDIEQAKRLIDAGKQAGVSAIKLQTYTADSLTLNGPQNHFKIEHPLWSNMTLHELYMKAQTPFEWMKPLFEYAKSVGITIFSAPFDIKAAELLNELEAPLFKIASFESIHHPLVQKVASFGKPMIISTGMSTLEQIEETIKVAREAGCKDIILLHCISAYPTPIEDANLATIQDLENKFGVTVGLSDHTTGTLVSELAIGEGATVIEKHIMLTKDDDCFDKAFSLVPSEFEDLVRVCQAVTAETHSHLLDNNEQARKTIGKPNYRLTDGEGKSKVFRPSILVQKDVKAGQMLSNDNLIIRRPGAGLEPKYWDQVIGCVATQDLKYGDALTWDKVSKNK